MQRRRPRARKAYDRDSRLVNAVTRQPLPQVYRTSQALAIQLALLIAETPRRRPSPHGSSVLSGMTW